MKKRFQKTIALLLVSFIIITLLPRETLAEEANQSSVGMNWIQEMLTKLETNLGQQKVNLVSTTRDEEKFASTVSRQTIADDEILETTAIEGDYEYADVEGGVAITHYKGAGGDIAIPETLGGKKVIKLGNNSFWASQLTSITIPKGVTSIGWSAFEYSSLARVSFPEGLTTISPQAFFRSNVTSLDIPEGVISIGSDAFGGCSELKSIKLPESLPYISNGTFSGCTSLTKITIPKGVKSINLKAFDSCTALTNVSLTGGIKTIGQEAFANCTALLNINLPEGITSIGSQAFYSCSSLQMISLPQSVTSISVLAFGDCRALQSIDVVADNQNYSSKEGMLYDKNGTTLIACPGGLYDVNLPDGVVKIGDHAFGRSVNIKKVSIPKGVTSLGNWAFGDCKSLTNVSLPEGLAKIGSSSFENCQSLTSIIINKGITYIDWNAFKGCKSLTLAILPEGDMELGRFVFSDCTELTNITIPEGVEKIWANVFMGCTNLKSIQFNSATTEILPYFADNYVYSPPKSTTFIGYDPSTAKDYAEKYGYSFKLIGSSSGDGSSASISATTQAIAVRDNDTRQPVAGVTVTLAGKKITTDSNGMASFENPASGEQTLVLNAAGYCDYETLLKATPGTAEVFYLRKDNDPNKPYVSMINLNDGSKTLDLFRQEKSYKERTSEASLTDADKAIITMKANWKGKTAKTYRLTQNGSTIMESGTGKFDKKALGQLFKPGYAIYALVVAADGTVSEAVETGIKITSASFSGDLFGGSKTGELRLGNKMGQTIPGNLPVIGGMDVDMAVKAIPATISVTPDSFKLAIGMEDLEDSAEAWGKYKKFLTDVKNKNKGLKDFKKMFKPKKVGTPITKGFEPEADIVGYIEGTFVDGHPVITGSTLIMKVGGTYSQQTQYLIGPVPVYLEVGGGLDMEMMNEIARIVPESGEIKLNTELTITPSFELGGGVGIASVVTVGAVGEVEMPLLTRFSDDYQKLSLTGSMSLKAKALFFEAKKEIAKGTWIIAEGYGNLDNAAASEMDTGMGTFNIYDASQYSLMSRDYAQNPTTWSGEAALSTQAADYTNQTLNVLQTNLFPNAQPKMVAIGDQQVMVWIADNTLRSSANRTMLVYSVYNQTTKVWGAPTAVADDSTADFYPQIASDGTSLYVVWQNSKTTFADTVTLTEAAKAGEIAVAKFNTTTKAFDAAVTLTSNDTLDTQPQLTVSGDKAAVVWTTNSANDLFGTTGRNSIQYAELNGYDWTSAQDLVSDQNAITGLAAGYTLNNWTVAFTEDGDNDLNTITDRELYAVKPGQSIQRLTNDETLDANPVFAQLNGTDTLFWYHNSNIAWVPAVNIGEAPQTVFAESKQGFGDTFSMVNNSDGKTAAIWTETRNETTEIHGALYDETTKKWSEDIQISNLGSRVQFPNGIFDQNGNFTIAFNRLTVKDDQTEQSDLCVLGVVPAYNLTLNNVAYSDDAITAKTPLSVEVEVTNNGQLPVNAVNIDIKDGETLNSSVTVNETIKPGETKTLSTTLNLPETITKKDYTIAIRPKNGDEYDLRDNAKTITLGYTDLALAVTSNELGGHISINAQLSNISDVMTNATLKVTEDTPDGKVLFEKDIANLAKGVNKAEIIELDPKTLSFTGDTKQIHISVTANGEEISTGDNSDFIVVNNPAQSEEPSKGLTCTYRTHVQNVGWQDWKQNGDTSGTSAQGLRLEGIEIKVDKQQYDVGVEYSTHVENIGWQELKKDGDTSGTSGKGLRLEAINIKLTGKDADKYDIYYSVHAENFGWLDWAKNGENSGTAGFGYRLEAIQIKIVPKGDPAPGKTDRPFVSKN